jgi:transposase
MENVIFIGMDVHKKNIVIASTNWHGKTELLGEYLNDDAGINKLIRKFDELSKSNELKMAYEAGPCGYTLKRTLAKRGYECEIIVPSLIPMQAGNRVKTDKRDAMKLSRLYRSGDLSFVKVPTEKQESVRTLVRCRGDVVQTRKVLKQKINHFLLRMGYSHRGSNWTKAYMAWIEKIHFDDAVLNITLRNYLNQHAFLDMQVKELEQEIEKIAMSNEYVARVKALCAFRGIGVTSAMVIITEVVSFRRFSNPKELMAYLGLVPSEYSSGGTIRKGSITKCGNNYVRKTLVESSWHYRHKPSITKKMSLSLDKISVEDQMIPIKAITRLHKRFCHLLFNGKVSQKAIVAVARELAGFIWAQMVRIEEVQA